MPLNTLNISCGDKFEFQNLTFDHILPKSRGGPTSWENIVSCCDSCNSKKADKTPTEAKMPLLSRPKEPNTLSMMVNKIKKADSSVFKNWLI